MNLIYYEIKSNLNATIIWIISLVSTFAFMMVGAYPIYSSAVDDVTRMLLNFPPEFTAAFGIELEKLFSYGGFYNFAFGYIALIGAIMASALSIAVFSREKRAKCSDFLLTKPISRESIFVKKLISCLSIIVAANIIYTLTAVFMFLSSDQNTELLGTFIIALLGIFFTQLVFMSIGIAYAAFLKKIRSVSGAATAFGFSAFILSAITNIFNDKNLELIAPLKYFEPNIIFETGRYDIKLLIMATVIIIACIVASFVKFCKSDAYAV